MPLDPDTRNNLKDTSWAYNSYDSAFDLILSNLETLGKEYQSIDEKKAAIFEKYSKIIGFKLEEVYGTMLTLQELVLNTTMSFYRKYHGPFREEVGTGMFQETRRNVTYSLESFLAQLKTLLDFSIKFAFELCTTATTPNFKVDSFEKLLRIEKHQAKPKYSALWSTLKSSSYFDDFIAEQTELSEAKIYRDYVIHHGYIDLSLSSQTSQGNVSFSYLMPAVSFSSRNDGVDYAQMVDLLQFCREKLFLVLRIIGILTDKMFDDSIRRPHAEALAKMPQETTKQILERLAMKEVFVDMPLPEKELKTFLKSRKIEFGELVEDRRICTRMNEGLKSFDGKDRSYIYEQIVYKPIGGLVVIKTNIYDRDWKPCGDHEPYYGVTQAGISPSDFSSLANAAEVLEHLQGCGLVYVSDCDNLKRYSSIRQDLKNLIVSLVQLRQYKWSIIQIAEIKYFRPRTPEETEQTKKILGDKAEEYMKREDEDRESIQREYEEWKKKPRYHDNSIVIPRKDSGEVVQRIFHKQYVKEKGENFSNWKQNRIIIESDGGPITDRFLPDDMFTQEFVQKIIAECEKIWKEEPRHFLEMEKQRIVESKTKYAEMIKETRDKFGGIMKKYDFLIPVFILMNKDVFDGWRP